MCRSGWSRCIISMRRGVRRTWSSAKGRILRQGNRNAEVQIYRYVTEGSFDAYMWQTLETKAKFIHQVMTGDTHMRHIEDIDSAGFDVCRGQSHRVGESTGH
jgi:hypothetical protein